MKDFDTLVLRDMDRDINAELAIALAEMHSAIPARKTQVEVPDICQARNAIGLSQKGFAKLLGISIRTLQEWEQGRRSPSGAAKVLIKVAINHPEVLKELPEMAMA